MAKYVIDSTTLTNIANAIRNKTATSDPILPTEMPQAIQSISVDQGALSVVVSNIQLNRFGILDFVVTPTGAESLPSLTYNYIITVNGTSKKFNTKPMDISDMLYYDEADNTIEVEAYINFFGDDDSAALIYDYNPEVYAVEEVNSIYGPNISAEYYDKDGCYYIMMYDSIVGTDALKKFNPASLEINTLLTLDSTYRIYGTRTCIVNDDFYCFGSTKHYKYNIPTGVKTDLNLTIYPYNGQGTTCYNPNTNRIHIYAANSNDDTYRMYTYDLNSGTLYLTNLAASLGLPSVGMSKMVMYNNKLYFAGGTTDPFRNFGAASSNIWEFNVANASNVSATIVGDLGTELTGCAAFLSGSNYYIMGGAEDFASTYSKIYKFNLASVSLEVDRSLPIDLIYASAAYDGKRKAYIFGGINGPAYDGPDSHLISCYINI